MANPAHTRIILSKGKNSNSTSGSLVSQYEFDPADHTYTIAEFRAVFATTNPSFSASVELFNLASDSYDVILSGSSVDAEVSASLLTLPTGSTIFEVRISSEDVSANCILGSAELVLTGS